jgi:hypothetical protein
VRLNSDCDCDFFLGFDWIRIGILGEGGDEAGRKTGVTTGKIQIFILDFVMIPIWIGILFLVWIVMVWDLERGVRDVGEGRTDFFLFSASLIESDYLSFFLRFISLFFLDGRRKRLKFFKYISRYKKFEFKFKFESDM